MGRDVLDLIDAALDDHEVSSDAMRWTPDAPEPGCVSWLPVEVWDRAIIDDANIWLTHHGHLIPDWQREMLGRMFKVPVSLLLSRAEVERRARLRRMHTEYHRRTRHRRTR